MPERARPRVSVFFWLLMAGAVAVSTAAQEPLPMGSEFQVSTDTAYEQTTPAVASDGAGDFVVLWSAQTGVIDGAVAGRSYDASGNPIGSEFTLSTAPTIPSGALPDVSTDAIGRSVGVWRAYSGVLDILGQRFEVAGIRLGSEFRVSTNTTDIQQQPVVASAADGTFVAAWASGDGPSYFDFYEVFARRFDATGVPLGKEFQVNTYDYLNQARPAIASAPDGRFVVVWESHWQDGSLGGVFGQQYEADGTRFGREFQVNSTTTDFQLFPSVAMQDDGSFVVLWESFFPSPGVISGQRYDAFGNTLGGEFEVAGPGSHPDVTSVGDGSFVAAWEVSGGNSYDISGQRYDASGSPVGGRFQVNTYTTGAQRYPALAAADDGRFVVTWQSTGQVGSYAGIFGQRYAGPGLHLEAEGSCPGPITVTIANAPANSEVGVIAAANTNGFVKGGVLCAGTELEIGEPFLLPPRWVLVDGAGTGQVTFELPADRCYLEALAQATCETSSAVRVVSARD